MPELNKVPTEELPAWMRQSQQSVDWGFLIVLAFSLMMAWPFVLQSGVPTTNAAENHVFMAADYVEAFLEGRLYPRWSAAAASGYGAPIPNFMPPGLPYVTGLVQLLFFPDDPALAMGVVMTVAFAFAGTMTYLFVMRISGPHAAVIAAMLYVFSPIVGLTIPHQLGDYPGVITIALYPALLWSASRLLDVNHPVDAASLALVTLAFVLVDPLALIPALGLLLILTLWYMLRDAHWGHVLLTAFALLTGVGLASFYWIPALLEVESVRWAQPILQPLHLVVRFPDVILPVQSVDLNELVPRVPPTLGGVLVLNVLLVLVAYWNRWRSRRDDSLIQHFRSLMHEPAMLHLVLLMAGGGLTAFVVIQQAEALWLMIPAVFALAVGGAFSADLMRLLPEDYRRLVPSFLLVLALSTPVWLAPRWSTIDGAFDHAAQIAYEEQGYGVAVMPPGEPIPVTLPEPIIPNRSLIEDYQDDVPIRIPTIRATGEKQANLIGSWTHRDAYLVSAERTVVFDILRAFAPGWQATLDGRSLRLEPNLANGLMQVRVPQTRDSRLTLTFGPTPERLLGWAVSLSVLVLVLVVLVIRLRSMVTLRRYNNLTYLPLPDARLYSIIGAGFFVTLLLFAVPGAPSSLYARLGYTLDNYTELRSRTVTGMDLLAYQIDDRQETYVRGDTIDVTLAWRALNPLPNNYRIQLHLQSVSVAALRWDQTAQRLAGGYPSMRWTPGQFVRDPYTLDVQAVVPGRYRIAVEVFACPVNCDNEDRVPFVDADGRPIGTILALPDVIVVER